MGTLASVEAAGPEVQAENIESSDAKKMDAGMNENLYAGD